MPVSQYSSPATKQPGVQTRPIVQPSTSGQSLDSTNTTRKARPASAFLKERRQNKTVRWGHSVIDNEKKIKFPRVRPLTPPFQKKSISSAAPQQSSIYYNKSHRLSTSTVVLVFVANTSMRMDSLSVRPPTHNLIPSGQSTFPRQHPWLPIQHPDQYVVAAASIRPPMYIPPGQQLDQAPAANSSLKRKHDPRSPHSMNPGRPSPSRGVTQMKTERPKRTVGRVLPSVPDPPQPKMQGPPPTPRITRLPSPDLPDISERKFCMCANCRRLVESKGKPVHAKMNAQIEAAMAYMKSVKK